MHSAINELEAAAAELEAELFTLAEREDGPGQRAAKEQLLRLLARSMGGLSRERVLQIIADAGRQTDAHGTKLTSRANGRANGRPVKPEPDLAYNARVGRSNRRVNVEVDADPNTAIRHIRELRQADPGGLHVAVVVHPVTGATIDGMVWDPRRKQARRMTAAEVNALRKGRLPSSVLPPPKRGQVNPAVPKRKARTAASVSKAITGAVAKLNKPTRSARPKPVQRPPRRRSARREGELEFAASELETVFAE